MLELCRAVWGDGGIRIDPDEKIRRQRRGRFGINEEEVAVMSYNNAFENRHANVLQPNERANSN